VKRIFLLVFIFISLQAYSQFYESGQDPARLRWKQIKTDRYTLIFPRNYSTHANRFACILNHALDTVPGSLNHRPRSIPILLHTHTNFSNGYVSWAPRRMEIYDLSPQDQYGQDWLEQLALHEYRHVVQVDKLNQGITRAASFLGGEQITGIVAGLVPRWFLEGDAVHSETAFSRVGRGRMPSFDMELRTLWLEREKPFSFNKMVRGSYKDYIPDHYQFGYKLSSFLRDIYGQDIFDKALNYTARKPFTLHPFYLSLHSSTGLNKKQIYLAAFSRLEKEWKDQTPEPDQEYTPRLLNLTEKKNFANYRFPQYLNDSVIIAEKTSLDKAPLFVLIRSDGSEKALSKIGYNDLVRLSSRNNLLIWAERKSHVRWENEGFSQIMSVDVSSGKKMVLSRHSRRFAPALSPSGNQYVAVEYLPGEDCRLVVAGTNKNPEELIIPAPAKTQLQQACWIDEFTLVAIIQNNKGKKIATYHLPGNQWKDLTESTYDELSDLAANTQWLFFRAGFTGLSQIFALSLQSGQMFQVTKDPHGAYYPAPDKNGKHLVFSSYSGKGFNLAEILVDSTRWVPFGTIEKKKISLYEQVSAREGTVLDFSADTSCSYTSQPYSKAAHLFRLHSWLPFYTNYDALQAGDPEVYPGLTLLSQNTLGTAFTTLAYAHKNGKPYLESTFTYKGLFPVFELSYRYGETLNSFPYDSTFGYPPERQSLNLRSYLPLNFSSGPWIRQALPSVNLQYSNDRYLYQPEEKYRNGMTALRYGLLTYQYLRSSSRAITPRFGQLFEMFFDHTPFENQQFGAIGYIRAGLYLPGLLNSHSIFLSLAEQKQFFGNSTWLYYHTFLSLPRGYASRSSEKLQKLSFNYYCPLFYPDLSLGTLLYLKRIRASAFVDYALGYQVREYINNQRVVHNRDFASLGGELLVDFHFFQIMFPLTLGIQAIYLPEEQHYSLYPVFRFDLSSF
jgi:Tol biopolymer transport system component